MVATLFKREPSKGGRIAHGCDVEFELGTYSERISFLSQVYGKGLEAVSSPLEELEKSL
jgi:hypothetical protein